MLPENMIQIEVEPIIAKNYQNYNYIQDNN